MQFKNITQGKQLFNFKVSIFTNAILEQNTRKATLNINYIHKCNLRT